MRDEIEAFGRKWKRVWQEDDATRNFPNNEGHEYVGAAWKRLFESEMPRVHGGAGEDWGDSYGYVVEDRLVVSSFDGDSIYVPASVTADPDPYTAMVREFHQRMGLVVRDAPGLGTPAEREERVRLMLEELLEMAQVLCVAIRWSNNGYPLEHISDVTISGTGLEPDTTSALHELADLQVTVSGTAVQFGLPLLAATREVHAANMEKTPQGPGRKPLKPAGWKPADVSRVLRCP